MYRCELCGSVVPLRTPCHLVVVETRMTHHPRRRSVHRYVWYDAKGKKHIDWLDDPGGDGPQIVREVRACPPCARKPPPGRNAP